MSGLSRHSLRKIAEDEVHLVQSIEDVLTTPIGSRVLRRDYGSELPDIIDRPQNGETIVDIVMATAEALERWEPRIDLTRVDVLEASAGQMSMALYADVAGLDQVIEVNVGGAT